MADEKKTYLVNVESNLKKYAEEAAEAKKKVDELKAANDLLKQSGTATTAEIEASNAALRNAQKEYNQAKKMVDLQTAANKSEIGSRKQLGEILKLQEQELGKLGKAYVTNAQGVRTLNPLYVEQRNRIAATKQAIIDYDQALNDGRSNIGRYGESVKSAFASAGKSMLAMISPMALITAGLAAAKKIFDGLKEAIMSTTGAMNAMNIVGQITKQMFYDIAINGKLSAESMMAAAEAAKLMNEKRIGDRKDMVEFSLLEREIAKLEFDAADKTKTRAERQDALNKAIAKQNELSDKKVADAKEDLRITEELIALRPKDDKLRDKEAEQIAKIIKLDQERFDQAKRNQAKLTAFNQEEIDARKKLWDAYMQEIDDKNKADDEAAKKSLERQQKLKQDIKLLEIKDANERALQKLAFDRDDLLKTTKNADEKLLIWGKYYAELAILIADQTEKNADIEWENGMKYSRLIFEQNKKSAKETWDALQERHDKEIKTEEEKEKRKLDIINAANQGIQTGADAVFESKKNRLNANLSAELSAIDNITSARLANEKLTAEQKEQISNAAEVQKIEINRRYAKEQQKIDIGQALINGALAIGNALATTKPFIPAGLIAAGIAAVQALAQVAVIKSQNFTGKGGSLPTAISASIPAQRAAAMPVGSSFLTQPQLTQPQLNALPNQNLLTADDIARALSRMPPPVVTVEDINAKIREKNKVDVRANI